MRMTIDNRTTVGFWCALVCAVALGAFPAPAYTVETPSGIGCFNSSEAVKATLERSLSPAGGATVSAGAPVTFSGSSSSPVTFAAASSPGSLSNPDIDNGLGSAQPSSEQVPTYTFTSTKVAATARTVYWNASFSNAGLPACAGQEPMTYTTAVRTLTVLAGPSAPLGPAPTPAPEPSPMPAPVQVSISASGSFSIAHPTVGYRIHCTAICSGNTYYHVLVSRRHARAGHLAKLDVGPRPVSITTTSGGYEQFAHSYRGSTLRMLKGLLHA